MRNKYRVLSQKGKIRIIYHIIGVYMSNVPTNWKPLKQKAVEVLVNNPAESMEKIAEEVGISRATIHRWMKEPEFVEMYYEKYMVTFGSRLPNVLNSMIREAEAGNVQAGRLVLEHSGKLIKRVEVKQRQSPFEKFLTSGVSVDDAEFQEAFEVLPQRPEVPKVEPVLTPAQEQRQFTRKQRQLKKRREARRWRNRAKAVGVKAPKKGRQTPKQRREWQELIEKRELEKGITPPEK